MNFLVFLVSLGAALRLTRLALADLISQPFRTFLFIRASRGASLAAQLERDANHTDTQPTEAKLLLVDAAWASRGASVWTKLVQLFDCPWCIGFWFSAATTYAALDFSGNVHPSMRHWWFLYLGLTAATSWLVGLLYTAAYTLEIWEPNGTDHGHGAS